VIAIRVPVGDLPFLRTPNDAPWIPSNRSPVRQGCHVLQSFGEKSRSALCSKKAKDSGKETLW